MMNCCNALRLLVILTVISVANVSLNTNAKAEEAIHKDKQIDAEEDEIIRMLELLENYEIVKNMDMIKGMEIREKNSGDKNNKEKLSPKEVN